MNHLRFLGARIRGDTKQVPFWGPTSISRKRVKFGGYMAPQRCAPLIFTAFRMLEINALCLKQNCVWYNVAVCFAMNRLPEKSRHVLYARSQNLRKATVSFVMSVCPSFFVRVEQLRFHWTDFHKIWYSSLFFSDIIEKIKILIEIWRG